MCDFTEMTPYIVELRAMRARVEESLAWIDTLSPAAASPSRDALSIPSPGLAGAGDPQSEPSA